jgi:hypothetical protein
MTMIFLMSVRLGIQSPVDQNNLNPHLPQWTLWAKPKSQPKPPKKRRPHRGHTLKAMVKK